jgi:glycosyltransferase involved in cell wall biosynthesis
MGSYNHEKYLAQAIQSILNQTFSDFELIVVDDASTDNSKTVIEAYHAKDSRVKAFFHKKNMGISKTLNDCLRQAHGKYVSFVGSDDGWFPNKLEKQLDVIERSQDSIVWSEGKIIDSQGVFVEQSVTEHQLSPKRKSGNLFQELLREDFVFGQSALLKTNFAREVAFDEDLQLVADHQFFVDLAKEHEFVFMDEPLAFYRVHGDNVTFKNEQLWFKERILLRNHFIEEYGGQISRRSMADIYYKIGHAYTGLHQKPLAQHYYLKALRINPPRANSLLYLSLALTGGDGFFGAFLGNCYQKMSSVLMHFSSE